MNLWAPDPPPGVALRCDNRYRHHGVSLAGALAAPMPNFPGLQNLVPDWNRRFSTEAVSEVPRLAQRPSCCCEPS